MPDLIQRLTRDGGFIEPGTITAVLGDRKYRVEINGREVDIRSMTEKNLAQGARVLVNRTENERFIAGSTGQLKSTEIKEVIIDG